MICSPIIRAQLGSISDGTNAGGDCVWHYECNGQPVGPVTEEAVKLLIRDGVLLRSTLVWKSGMSAWVNADETELMRHFDTPPPLTLKSNSLRTVAEAPSEVYKPRTEPGRTQAELAKGYAESPDDVDELASISPQTSDTKKRPYEANATAAEPLAGIAGHAKVTVVAFVLVSLTYIISDVTSIAFIGHALSGDFQSQSELDSQASTVDAFSQYAAIAYLLIFAWSAIVIGRWTYRAMKNLRSMGHETTVSPGWAVGWHLVPIAWLWMPFRGMAQIWRGSIHGAPTGEAALPAAMRLWWAAWLFGNWFSFGAFQMQESGLASENFELVQTALGLGIVGSGSHIVSALLLLGLMKKVTRAQSDQPAMQFN